MNVRLRSPTRGYGHLLPKLRPPCKLIQVQRLQLKWLLVSLLRVLVLYLLSYSILLVIWQIRVGCYSEWCCGRERHTLRILKVLWVGFGGVWVDWHRCGPPLEIYCRLRVDLLEHCKLGGIHIVHRRSDCLLTSLLQNTILISFELKLVIELRFILLLWDRRQTAHSLLLMTVAIL